MISTVIARVGQAMSHSLAQVRPRHRYARGTGTPAAQVRPREAKRRAATAIREAEERHRTLLDFCPEGVLVEVDGKIVYCNPAIIELSGFPADEILGKSPTEFIAPEDRERAVAVVGKLLAGTPGDTREYRVSKKDGTIMFAEISSRLITYTGKPALFSVIRDVTERKAAGAALSLRTQELEALFNIASVLVQPGEFEEKAARVLEEVARVARADWVIFRQRAEDGHGFRLVAAVGPEILRNPPMPVSTPSEPLSALAALNGEIVVANDYAARPDASPEAVAMGMNSIVVMPVNGAGNCLGVMNVVSKTANHFGPDLLKLLAAIADGLGVLLENAQLGLDLQANVEEMATVDEIARILTSTLDIDLVYERFAAEVKKVMDFDRMGINVVDQEAGVLTTKYLAGEPVSGITVGLVRSLEGSETQQVMTTRRSVVRSDFAAEYRFPRDQDRLDAGLRSGIRVPLVAKGRVGGSLFLRSRRVGAYGPREQRVLERLAAQIAPAVENSELYGQIKSNAEEMAAVDEIARILTSTLDINQFYDHFAAEVKQLVAFDRIGIGIIDQSNGTYSMNYTAGLEVTGAPAEAILSLDGSLTEHLIQTHKTHIRSNMSDSDQYGSIDERRVDAGIRSAIAVPLISSGRVVAALSLVSLEIDAYGPREQRIMERLVSQIAPAIENAQLYEQTKLAGEATRVSEEKYRTLVNESPDMIFVSRIDDYRITEVNDRACEQYGYSVKEFQAMNIIDLEIEPPLPEQVRSLYDNTPIGQVVEVYGINKRIDGTTFPVHVRFAKLDNVFAIANVRDITDQRTAEQALQESEARFRQIAENMNQVVSLIDHKDFKYLYVNDAYEEIWGQPCQNLYDNPKTWLEAVHPDDHSRVEAVLNNQHEQEFRIIRPDGTVRWIFGRSFPIHDEAGEVYRLVGICEDITERKETEERMHETARLAAIGELAAGVAHEINNPLTGVLGYSELLLAEDWPKQAREDLQRVHSNAQRAAKVVQNLLSFSRKQGFRARYTDLTPIVARVLDMKSYDLTTSNIQVTQELSPDLPHTMMDEHQLIQAIIVLLTNAEQSLRGFRRDGSVVIRTTRSETHIRLSVTDNGPGIAPEVLTRIFEPFFTTKEVGEGTGLGLSICYGIVRQHNGKIWAESVPGEGATFHIELPIMGPEDENDLPPHDEHRQTHASAGHLLVVDDEPHIRDLLVRVLEQERYTVDLAKEGEEAWNMLMERSYDCIVLDLKMPGVCGRELYQRINESNYELARKVIFITGDTISNNTLDFILSTGNLVVSKPLDMDVLLMQVRKCLEATRNAR